jgi:hypothetical protein
MYGYPQDNGLQPANSGVEGVPAAEVRCESWYFGGSEEMAIQSQAKTASCSS